MSPSASIAAIAALGLALSACGETPLQEEPDASPGRAGPAVLDFGGDVFLARFAHPPVDEHGYAYPFEAIRDLLDASDLALLNLEAVVSSRGRATPKQGETSSYLFRGRPDMLRVLTEAGVDVVNGANNHSGDYGPEALREQMELFERAGIAYVGIGRDREDARRYRLLEANGLAVALIGADMTTPEFAAVDEAGTSWLDEADPDHAVAVVGDQVRRARAEADVVLLTVHWGPNLAPRPTEARRELAARLVLEAGIDGILGHSAHVVQGMEIIDGKPVIYDAGNAMLDYDGDGWTHKSALFRLVMTDAGIESVELLPIRLHHTRTEPADAQTSDEILARFEELSREFDPEFSLDDGRIDLGPRGRAPARRRAPTFERSTPADVPAKGEIVPNTVIDRLPDDVVERSHHFENGVTFLGHRPLPDSARQGHGFFVTSYWTTDRAIDESLLVRVRLRPRDGEGPVWGNGDTYRDHHPGDWSYPTTLWEPGEIIEDRYFVRGHRDASRQDHELSLGLSSGGEVYLGDILIE